MHATQASAKTELKPHPSEPRPLTTLFTRFLWEAVKPGLDWSLDSGLDWTMDWTLDWTGLEEMWVQLLLAIDYFIRDREVLVLWLQHLGAV